MATGDARFAGGAAHASADFRQAAAFDEQARSSRALDRTVDATAHLDAMNRLGPNPWPLSFSYGRAMQSAALKLWSQDLANNVGRAQDTVFARARDNGLAALGKWTKAA
jgi:hypothetical protein